jgi:hypothetical protein
LLKVGDLIYAYHEALGITAIYTVTQVWVHVDPVIVLLTIEGEVIEATPEHPFFVEGYGWVAAGNLWTAARIRKLNGNYGLVQSVEIVQREQAMYNLSVAEAHTFFVGGGEWLVHNDGCGDRLPFYKGGKTQGILDTGTDEIDLISGRPTGERKLPPNAPGSKVIIADHVEAQDSWKRTFTSTTPPALAHMVATRCWNICCPRVLDSTCISSWGQTTGKIDSIWDCLTQHIEGQDNDTVSLLGS